MLKRLAKKIIFKSKFKTGRHKKISSANHRLILMYHGVSSKDLSNLNGRHLPKAQFEKQLNYFKEHFTILPLKDIISQKEKGDRPFISLTFDDGYENNLLRALPLLEKYNVAASFFIPGIALEDPSPILFADK